MLRLSLILVALLPLLFSVHAADWDQLTFTVDPSSPISPPILPNLVAFSIEVYDFSRWTSLYPSKPRQPWVNLMRQLMLTPGQEGPRYRIGGDSADTCAFNHTKPPSVPGGRPLTCLVNATDLLSWNGAMQALNSKMTLDMNFRRGDNATWAVEYVQGIDSVIGWDNVVALEVGNEIDLYGGGERYRPAGYNYTIYKKEYQLYVASIQAAVPNLPKRIFQGIVEIGWDWLANYLDDYLSVPLIEQSLYSISQHDYPVPSCIGNNVTIDDILDDAHSSSTSDFLTQHDTIAKLHAHNISFVVGEGSDAVCNGEGPMVLNTFSTALWVVDQLMQAAAVGVEHWYFHSWGTETETFSVLVYGNRVAPTTFLVQPIYYGLRMFAQATSHNARVVKLSAQSTNSHVHAFATLNEQQRLAVVVVHKDLRATQPTNVTFTVPLKSAPTALISRLVAPSITSEYGVSLAGQTYDGSQDGMPIGTETLEEVDGVVTAAGVQYTFVVHPLSAVMLTLPMTANITAEPDLLKFFRKVSME